MTAVGEADHFGDRYDVLRSLGEGGMGVVYEVFDRQRGTRVALKTAQHLDANALYRFKAEFRALADVAHPGLVSLYDLVTEGPRAFYTMELVEGMTFLEWTRGESGSACADTVPSVEVNVGPRMPSRRPPALLSPGAGCDLARLRSASRQLAQAIVALHDAGKLHRDLKPSNVLVTPKGRVVVLDFGLAVELGRDRISKATGIAGTAEYMSPEHAASRELTRASDWYSFGVMLYEALTGRLPLEGHFLQLILDKQRVEPPRAASLADIPVELDALCHDLLERDPKKRPSGAEILRRLNGHDDAAPAPSTSTRSRDAPFVGREAQMQELRDAFAVSSDGNRAVVLHIKGSSGMGKSSLLARFTEELAEGTSTVVLAGRCYERETVPFKAVDSLVDATTRFLRKLPHKDVEALLPSGILTLARVFPVLSRVQSVAMYPRRAFEIPDLSELRRHAFAAFRELLHRLAIRSKVVLLLDDLQWGDSDSAVLLSELLRMPDAPPLLVVFSYRSEDADTSPLLVALRGSLCDVEQRHVEVGPLALADSERLARLLLSDTPWSASDFAGRIAKESHGSPYFVDELVRFAKAGGGLDGLSLRLDDALHQRISALPDDCAALLRTVAVAGGVVLEEIATRATDLNADAARRAVAQLRAEHLLRGMRSGTALDTFHDRVRETVIAHLDAAALRSIHARLAATLLSSGTADPEVLTLHFGAAGQKMREAESALAAAKKAEAALAFGRAAQLYERILELGVLDQQRLGLRVALGDALTNAGRWGEAAELRLALAADVEPIRASQLRTIAAEQFLCSGRFDRGEAVLEGVLRDARVYVPRSPLTTLLALVAARIVLWLRGLRYTLQKKPLPQDVAIRIDSLISAGYGLGMTDEARGAYFSTRALIQSLGAGDPERLVRTLASEVGYSSAEGQKASKSASALLDRLRTLTLAVDTPFARAMLAAMTGWYQYFVVQDFAAAREGFLQAQRMLSELYAVTFWVRTTVRTMLFRAMVQLGDRNELAERVAATYREMDETRDLHGLVNLWTGPLAWQRLVDDRPEVADAELEKATLHLPKGRFLVQTYFHLLATVQLCLYRGQVEPAFQKMEQSWKPLRWSLLLRVGVIRVQALELRGRAALAAAAAVTGEERERRLRRVEDVVLRLPREGTAWAKGYAELLRAGAEALRSHGPEANRLAQEAERTFAGASMKLHVAASQWVQGVCVGGEEGAALVEVARRAMAAAGVERPERLATMLAPAVGFAARDKT